MLDDAKKVFMKLLGKPTDGRDRRRHARYVCSHKSLVRYENIAGEPKSASGVIKNISVSGALFEPEQAFTEEPIYDNCKLMIDGVPYLIRIIRVSYSGLHIAFDTQMPTQDLVDFLAKYGRQVEG